MGDMKFFETLSRYLDGCPNCKSKKMYFVCGDECGAICADCGWHNEGISDEHARETLKSIRACEKARGAENDNVMLCKTEYKEGKK